MRPAGILRGINQPLIFLTHQVRLARYFFFKILRKHPIQ